MTQNPEARGFSSACALDWTNDASSNQSLDFDTIREAFQVQFPDHRPTPPVQFLREFDGMKNDQSSNPHRQQAKGQPSRNASRTPHDSMQKGKRKDTTKGPQLCLREANDVEDATQEEAEEVDDPQADEDEEKQVEQDPNSEDECEPAEPDDPAAELAEVARCLTVTARRLQGLTLGRELSGGSKTIA